MTAPGGVCRTPDCDQIVADAYVCNTCVHRLRVALGDVPELLDELDVDLTRQGRRERQPGGRAAGARPLPFDPGASHMVDAVVRTLRTWCLIIDGDLLGHPPADTGHALAAHLLDRLGDVRQHADGGMCVDEVTAATLAARNQLYGVDRVAQVLAGYCPECGTAVYARPQSATARCHRSECRGTVDAVDWRRRALEVLDAEAMTAADAARALTALGHPVNADRIRQWARRGKLRPVWADQLRRPMYLVAHVRDLITN